MLQALPIVFDLDGTLVHTLPDIAAALSRVFTAHDLPAPDESRVRRMIGDGARTLVARALEAAGVEADDARIDTLYRAFLDDYGANACVASRPFPGVIETLAELHGRGHPLGVCTNKPERSTHLLLDGLGLAPFFAAIVGGDRLPFRKPDPRHLGAVLDRLAPQDGTTAVMVGDSRNDLLAARGLGIRCVLVRHGYGEDCADELGADLVIDGFADLPAAIRELTASRG
ncbi:Phosphoglycolate phosphatase [bacterium HR40]|nr:Phosphoglycolate phosphatase [bacterium HR40]